MAIGIHIAKERIVVGHLVQFRPSILIRELASLGDQLESIFIISSLKWWFSFSKELSEDATYRPYVDFVSVTLVTKEKLGCSVPPSHYHGCQVPLSG